MSKVVKVSLSVAGVEEAIKPVQAYRKWLKDRTSELLVRLAQEGFEIASAKFAKAVYDGTNDVSVTVGDRGSKAKAIVAVGNSVLFIEFGTGVTYPDNHPEAGKHGMTRGDYGQGKGKQGSWGYYGEPGTNGQLVTNRKGRDVVITHGNPANMSMYETVKELQDRLPKLAREVFHD